MRSLLSAIALFFVVVSLRGDSLPPDIQFPSSAFPACNSYVDGRVAWDTTAKVWKSCSSNTWSEVGGAQGSIPAGLIVMTLSSCPTGFSQVTSLSGKFVLGTVAANGDVTGTGGADNITPAGSNSAPAFTGTAFTSVINHTHGITDPGHNHTQNSHNHTQDAHTHTQNSHNHTQDPHSHGMAEGQTDGAGTFMDRSNAASATTSTTDAATATNQAATAVNQNATATNQAATATNQSATTGISTQNPAGGVSSITPAGTVAAPTFTGTSFDNRPAFVKVIFCSKD